MADEFKEKIELFRVRDNHRQLKVHKLKGALSDKLSFSVNYKYRIIFIWISSDSAVLLAIGDHDTYN